MNTAAPTGSSRHGRLFWAGVVVGGAVMAFGVAGLVADQRGDQVVNWLTFLVGLDLAHDAVVAPAACAAGVLVTRALPPSWRAPVQAGLLASAAVLLVAAAPLRHTAERVGNPTLQPLDYRTATLTALAIVWGVVLAVTLLHRRARRPQA